MRVSTTEIPEIAEMGRGRAVKKGGFGVSTTEIPKITETGRGRAVKKGGFGVTTTEFTEITEMGRGRTVGSPGLEFQPPGSLSSGGTGQSRGREPSAELRRSDSGFQVPGTGSGWADHGANGHSHPESFDSLS